MVKTSIPSSSGTLYDYCNYIITTEKIDNEDYEHCQKYMEDCGDGMIYIICFFVIAIVIIIFSAKKLVDYID